MKTLNPRIAALVLIIIVPLVAAFFMYYFMIFLLFSGIDIQHPFGIGMDL